MVTLKNTEKTKNTIKVFKDSNSLFIALAQDFVLRASKCIQEKDSFSVVLSGGETPKKFFEKLTDPLFSKQIDWGKIKFFFGDERFVPETSSENNYHTALQYLFSKVPIKKENVYPIVTNYTNAEECAKAYSLSLRSVFHLTKQEYPKFDLVYLGLGDDGHTASLMPFSDIVEKYSKEPSEQTKYQSEQSKESALVESLWFPKQEMYRITLTPNAINHGDSIIFVVNGVNKADAVKAILEGEFQPQRFPAQLIQGLYGNNLWFIDKEAASKLSSESQIQYE